LVSVTGGKLTTFRLIALDVIKAVHPLFPEMPEPDHDMPVLNQVDQALAGCGGMREACRRRLLGRYGAEALLVVEVARKGEMESIPGTDILWVELRWAARSEGICHLEDLLLRRTRLGLILPHGAESIMSGVKRICMEELGWNNDKWLAEFSAFNDLIDRCYTAPDPASIPDWRILLAETLRKRKAVSEAMREKRRQRSIIMAIGLLTSVVVGAVLWKYNKRAD
jgi:glycerol-3-phosphate dehydrogenase